mmetsp:Transcript_43414/g.137244  ORF Transcript_43414/g.137244 Transcript_43414/m.137244 type:complete len:140 (+) Transcript_43414:456-875(+)
MQCRIFQKEGMIERLEGLLVPLDEMKYSFTCSCSDQPDLPAGRTGTVPCDDFINAITRSQLLPLRLSQFLRDQRLSKGSKTVDYLTLLERLKIERNRKLGSLQRARDVFRKGLMRWQKNLLWKHFVRWSDACGPGTDIV